MKEMLKVLGLLSLGMPAGVFMLNECIVWNFTNHSSWNPLTNKMVTKVTGRTFGNSNVCTVVCEHGFEWTEPKKCAQLHSEMQKCIQHSWVWPMISKANGIPPITVSDNHV